MAATLPLDLDLCPCVYEQEAWAVTKEEAIRLEAKMRKLRLDAHAQRDAQSREECKVIAFSRSITRNAAVAFKYAVWANKILWGSYLCFPLLVWAVMARVDCDNSYVLVEPPSLVWVIYGLPLSLLIFSEFKAYKWMAPDYTHWLQQFSVCSCPITGTWYTIYNLGMSMVSHMDIATTSVFLVRILKDQSCSGVVTTQWQQHWTQSPSLGFLASAAYLAMSSQIVFLIGYGVPCAGRRVTYSFLMTLHHPWSSEEDAEGYHADTKFASQTSTLSLVESLADAARMRSLTSRRKAINQMVFPLFSCDATCRNEATFELFKIAMRTSMFLCLETTVQCWLQVMVFNCIINVNDGQFDHLTCVSIFLSMAMGLQTLGCTCKEIATMFTKIWPYCHEDDFYDSEIIESDSESQTAIASISQSICRRTTVVRSMVLFCGSGIISILSLTSCAATMVAHLVD